MGQVYRAHDTKLKRDVALKVLPDAFASDPERLARFTREAHALASLNHTNIAHIHGFEESSGVRALVMELVEGLIKDPRQRIRDMGDVRLELEGYEAETESLGWLAVSNNDTAVYATGNPAQTSLVWVDR